MNNMQTMKRLKLDNIIKPVKQDSNGEMFAQHEVRQGIMKIISIGNQWQNSKVIHMSENMKDAVKVADEVNDIFDKSINNLQKKEHLLAECSKKVSSSVRKSANELSNGLLKIEKTADFGKLEKYTELLERSAAALTALAELENDGTLEKIAKAIG